MAIAPNHRPNVETVHILEMRLWVLLRAANLIPRFAKGRQMPSLGRVLSISMLVTTGVVIRPSRTSAAADAQRRFVLITGDKPGIKQGNVFYPVGMKATDFAKEFGAPESRTKHEFHYYKQGLSVHVADSGEVTGYEFCFVEKDYTDIGGGTYRPANAATDKGVKAGDSYEDVTRAHGRPVKESKAVTLLLQYRFGVIFFDEAGNLESINISRLANAP